MNHEQKMAAQLLRYGGWGDRRIASVLGLTRAAVRWERELEAKRDLDAN